MQALRREVARMCRLLTAMVFTLAAGCSPREPVPRITEGGFREVQSHYPLPGRSGDPEFFASPRGRELTTKMLRQIYSDRGIAVIRRATRVECFQIYEPRWHRGRAPASLGEIEGYPITAVGPVRGREFATLMADDLLDGRFYFIRPACIEQPDVAFRLWDGPQAVILVMDTRCGFIQVVVRDAARRAVHRGCGFYWNPFEATHVMQRLAEATSPDGHTSP